MPRTSLACRSTRRGAVAVMVAILLVAILGVVALSLEGGLFRDSRRRVQNAADAGANAAAVELFRSYPTITAGGTPVYDPQSRAARAALDAAATSGFPNDGKTAQVVVNIPPTSGPFAGKVGTAEVIVTYYQPRYFSSLWGSNTMPVSARCVARGRWTGTGNGVIVLDPTLSHALDASGQGTVTVTGGASMIVNSKDSEAARVTGGGGMTAVSFEITGSATGSFNGPVNTGQPPIPDPLAYLPAPSVPSDGRITSQNKPGAGGGKIYTLTPGRHTNLPNFTSNDEVIFQQASANSAGGIYFIDGGGLISTGADMHMDPNTTGGLMIYNRPRSGAQSNQIKIAGGSGDNRLELRALTSGPYAGILFWQDRTSDVSMAVTGGSVPGKTTLLGTFYAANAQLSITGQGDAVIGSQYISRSLSMSGGGNITIDYSDNSTGRQREVFIVE